MTIRQRKHAVVELWVQAAVRFRGDVKSLDIDSCLHDIFNATVSIHGTFFHDEREM